MEIVAIIVIGGLLASFLGGGKGGDREEPLYPTKATDDGLRIRHIDNERYERERVIKEASRRN